MQSPLALTIGKRYSSVRSRNLLTGFISLLSITGLGLGVAILITVLSVMNGFDRELQDRILAMVPHITLYDGRTSALQNEKQWQEIATSINALPGVTGSSPFLQLQGMLLANGKGRGVVLNGINPEAEGQVSAINEFSSPGSLESLRNRDYNILIGEELANTLEVSLGDTVTLVSTVVPITPLGEFTRKKQFTVSGLIRVGSELDNRLAVVHIGDAQRVYRLGDGIHGLRLQVNDLFAVEGISRTIRSDITNDFQISNWTWEYGNIYENIRLSKTLVGLLLSLLVAVAAFNVVVSLVMVVRDKQGDIAILRTMGASLGNIRNIFLVQGFSIGLIGTGVGLLLGIIFSLTVSDIVLWLEQLFGIRFLSADIYPINYLPSQIRIADLLLVCFLSLFLTMLATLLPASVAARTDPAVALRYE